MRKRLRNFWIGTLRGRLILGVATVHAAMMSLFVLDLTWNQKIALLEDQSSKAIEISRSLATSAAGWIASNDIAGLQELVEEKRRYPELLFAILADAKGRILAHTDRDKVGLYLLDLPSGSSGSSEAVLSRSAALVDAAVPAMLGERHVGWSRIGIGQGKASLRLAALTLRGWLYAAGAIAFGSLVAWLLGRGITRRLYVVQETMGRVRGGQPAARVGISGSDEAASIAREFNATLDMLEERGIALKRSEEWHRMLLMKIHAAVVVHGSDTRILMSNPSSQELLGLSEEQMTGKAATDPAWRFLRDDGSDMPLEEYPVNSVLHSRQPLRNFLVGIRRPDLDRPVWALVNADPALDEGGAISEVIVTFIDVSERKRAEEALRSNEEKFAVAFYSSPNLMAITTPMEGRIMEINEAYCRVLGRTREECVGRGTEELRIWADPEQRDRVVRKIKENGRVRDEEADLRGKSGEIRTVVLSMDPITINGEGLYLSVAMDITERKRAETEVRHLKQRSEMILDSAGEGIYGTDVDGDIVFMNKAARKMLGLEGREVVGLNSHRTFHHTKADGHPYPMEECPLHRSLVDGESHRGVGEVFWTSDGKKFPVEHINTPLVDFGAVVGAVVVFTDITERRKTDEEIARLNESLEKRVEERTSDLRERSEELRVSKIALVNLVEDLNEKTAELEIANEKLKDVDRVKSLFIASMSHELRTPLNSIIGFSSILLNEWTGPLSTEQKSNLATILRSGKHLLALINDVIDVSKIEAGKLESVVEDFDMYDVVAETAQTFAGEIQKKGLAAKVRAIHRSMRGDRRRLLQCLLNLASNAVKYTETGSIDIDVEIADEGGACEFIVSDTGIGIKPEDVQRLFSPFFRASSPSISSTSGTGLGLYLAKKLAREVLGGDISVASEYGKGSRFALKIPLRV